MKFRLAVLSLIASVGVVLLLILPARSQAQLYTVPIDYSTLISTLVSQPPAQLRLPSLLASLFPLPVEFYYGTGSITANTQGERTGYAVAIQIDPASCRQALSCTEAYADATAIDSASPSIQEQYSAFYNPVELSYMHTAGHTPFTHRLSNGQSVTILPWTEAGAGMGYEKGVWDECDTQNICYRYVIGLKGGDADALIAMLESIGADSRRANSNGGGIVSGD